MGLSPLALAIVLPLTACAKTAVHEESATGDDLKSAPTGAISPVDAESEDAAAAVLDEPKDELDKVAVAGGAQQAGVAAGRRDLAAATAAVSANEQVKMRQEAQA